MRDMPPPAFVLRRCFRILLVASRVAGLIVVACLLSACERPEIVEPANGSFMGPIETDLSFDLVNGTFRLDGIIRTNRLNLSTDRFAYLFFFVKARGLFIVTVEQSDAGVIAGRFTGDRLTFEIHGTRIELESGHGALLEDQEERKAWVEHLPEYDLLGPDAMPDEAVVGLARQKNQIPGFTEQN